MTRTTIVTLLAGLVPAALGAQVPDTARAAADTAAADTSAIPLAPIRVSVLRTPLLLAETPYAITVEGAASAGPGLTLAESLGSVPGLQVDNRYNFSQGDRLSVRGLGARAQFGVRGVKVLVDGIPATLPDGQTSLSHLDPRWIERAEVVRGPASSLWGNAAGGVIQLRTAGVPTGGAEGAATVLAGSHGLVHYGAEAGWGREVAGDDPPARGSGASSVPGSTTVPPRRDGGPTARTGGPRFGLRATASRLLYDGFREHASADKRFGSIRAEWTGEADAVSVIAHAVRYEARNPGSLSDSLLAEDRTQAYGFNVVQQTGESAAQAQLGATWQHAFSGSALELSTWLIRRELDNPIPPVIIDLSRWAAGARASLRGTLETVGGAIDWVAGVDVEGQWDDRLNWENDAGERGALLLDQAERVTSLAPFVQASAPVAGPVSVLAGLRYDRHAFAVEDGRVTAGDPATDDSGDRVMDQLSPSLGVTAELGPASVYATVASSFETPTTTELVNRPAGGQGFNPDLEPQRAWSVEAGGRARLGDRARVHAAVYRMAIRDALIPFEVPTAPGRTFFRNAGSALHRGLELDAWVTLGAGVSARLGYARVDARFDEFVTPDGDWSGNRVPGVAPHRITGRVTWTADGRRVSLQGRWVDAIPVVDADTATAPSYAVFDLRATTPALPLAGGAITVFGGIDNVLDAEYVASVVVNAFGGRYYEPGPGRSVYLGVRVEP